MSDTESGRAASAGQGAAAGEAGDGRQVVVPGRAVTAADLAGWQALADAATPGPWFDFNTDDDACMNAYGVSTDESGCWSPEEDHEKLVALTLYQSKRVVGHASDKWAEDAEFIAAARAAVPRLVARVRELEAERDEARNTLTAAFGFASWDEFVASGLKPVGSEPTVTLDELESHEDLRIKRDAARERVRLLEGLLLRLFQHCKDNDEEEYPENTCRMPDDLFGSVLAALAGGAADKAKEATAFVGVDLAEPGGGVTVYRCDLCGWISTKDDGPCLNCYPIGDDKAATGGERGA